MKIQFGKAAPLPNSSDAYMYKTHFQHTGALALETLVVNGLIIYVEQSQTTKNKDFGTFANYGEPSKYSHTNVFNLLI